MRTDAAIGIGAEVDDGRRFKSSYCRLQLYSGAGYAKLAADTATR